MHAADSTCARVMCMARSPPLFACRFNPCSCEVHGATTSPLVYAADSTCAHVMCIARPPSLLCMQQHQSESVLFHLSVTCHMTIPLTYLCVHGTHSLVLRSGHIMMFGILCLIYSDLSVLSVRGLTLAVRICTEVRF